MHIKTLKTSTYYYNSNNTDSKKINLTTLLNIFKTWGQSIQTFSNEEVSFENKQPTQVLLKLQTCIGWRVTKKKKTKKLLFAE